MNRKLIILSVVVLFSLIAAPLSVAQASGTTNTRCVRTHIVAPRENLYRIARYYGTSVAALTQINGLYNPNRIYVGQTLCVAVEVYHPRAYVVQRGDTIFRIARTFGVNPWVLAQYNNLYNPNRIYVGQVLYIPDVTIQ